MSSGRLPFRVLLMSFEGCCILTSGTDLSEEPSLQLSSDNTPSSSFPLAAVFSFAFTLFSFPSFLLTGLVFRFCFPFDSLESLLGGDSHLLGITTLIISSLKPSGIDLLFGSVFLFSSLTLCSDFFGSTTFRVTFATVSAKPLPRLSTVPLGLLSFPTEHVLISRGRLDTLMARVSAFSVAFGWIFTAATSVLVFLFLIPLFSCRDVLAVTVLILLFVGKVFAKLVVTLSQPDGLSLDTGVVSLLSRC